MKNKKKRMIEHMMLFMMMLFLIPINLSFTTAYANEQTTGSVRYIVEETLHYYILDGDTTGYYQIDSANDLNTLAKVVNKEEVAVVVIDKNGEKTVASIEDIPNQNAKLMNDIDATEVILNAIGNQEYSYNGIFDGNNYTITVGGYAQSALFGFVGNSGTIKNVTVEAKGLVIANNAKSHYALIVDVNDGVIDRCTAVGMLSKTSGLNGIATIAGIVCENRGSIKNCVNHTNILISWGSSSEKKDFLFVAGICARNVGGKIENSSNIGNITAIAGPNVRIAGIVAEVASGDVANCYNSGVITQGGAVLNCRTAGVIAQITDLNEGVSGVFVSNCVNVGTIKGTLAVGGVIGNAAGINTAEDIVIKNCYNKGNVISDGGYAAGIVMQAKYTTIIQCVNLGNVSSKDVNTAGILGGSGTAGNVTIRDCYNHGNIQSNGNTSSNAIAGVAGQICTSCIVSNCYNDGTITGGHSIGGIVGLVATSGNDVKISDCYNCGQVTAMAASGDNDAYYVGGIVGLWSNSTTGGSLENCYSTDHTIYKETVLVETMQGTDETTWSGYVIGRPAEHTVISGKIDAYSYSKEDWDNKINMLSVAYNPVTNIVSWNNILNSLYDNNSSMYAPWNINGTEAVLVIKKNQEELPTPTVTPTQVPTITVTPAPTVTIMPGVTFVESTNEIILNEQGEEVTFLVQKVGTTNQLSVANLSSEEEAMVVWESTDEMVAEIDNNGNVTMKSSGMAELIVTIGEGENKRIERIVVIVAEKPEFYNEPTEAIEYIRLGTSWADIPVVRTLFLGDSVDIAFWGVKNWKKEKYEYHWESSDETVMTTDGVGYIQANAPGVATLSLKLKNKATGKFLNVKSIEVVVPEDIKMPIMLGTSSENTFESLVLKRNERVDLNFYGIENWNEEMYECQWTSSEPTVVWVDNEGNLTPVQEGKAIITLTMIEKETGNPLYVIPVEVVVPEM